MCVCVRVCRSQERSREGRESRKGERDRERERSPTHGIVDLQADDEFAVKNSAFCVFPRRICWEIERSELRLVGSCGEMQALDRLRLVVSSIGVISINQRKLTRFSICPTSGQI